MLMLSQNWFDNKKQQRKAEARRIKGAPDTHTSSATSTAAFGSLASPAFLPASRPLTDWQRTRLFGEYSKSPILGDVRCRNLSQDIDLTEGRIRVCIAIKSPCYCYIRKANATQCHVGAPMQNTKGE